MNAHLAAALLSMTACGLPIPTDDAQPCAARLYIQPGSGMTCAAALKARDDASRESGADLTQVTVEFTRGENLAELGYPNAWGRTEAGTVAVVAHVAVSLVHEALHVRYGPNHCNWSRDWLAYLEQHGVPGEFYDECRHVTCTSSREWNATWEGTDQVFGNSYTCN